MLAIYLKGIHKALCIEGLGGVAQDWLRKA
jgi:hypothetical protein